MSLRGRRRAFLPAISSSADRSTSQQHASHAPPHVNEKATYPRVITNASSNAWGMTVILFSSGSLLVHTTAVEIP